MTWHKRFVRKTLRDAIRARAKQHASGRLIDIGCGSKQYEHLLAPYVTKHVGVDQAGSPHGATHIDIVASAYEIPVESGSFDTALMTEVLEHLEEPQAALRECARVLRPGGVLILTAPFIWHLHEEPRDFYRYSKYGLEHLLVTAGFEIVEMTALGGFWTTFAQLLAYNLEPLDRGIVRMSHVMPVIGEALIRAAIWLEVRSPRPQWPSHHIAVARLPQG